MADAMDQSPDKKFANIGRKPNRTIVVPREYQRTTTARERERLAYTLKLETGCEVVPRWDMKRIKHFEVFGGGPCLDKAVQEINHWILNAPKKSAESSAWAKLPAFDNNKWYYEQIKESENRRKQQFKEPIPEDAEITFKVVVDWPKDLSDHDPPVFPHDVFGLKLEALNPIRLDHEVYITLKHPEWQIEIRGTDMEYADTVEQRVDSAEQRVRSLIQKIQTQTFGANHTLYNILDVNEGIDVLLEEAPEWWPNRQSHRIVPRLVPSPMMNEPGDFRQDGLHHTQLEAIQYAVRSALEAVRYEKGYYNFNIRFGCFALRFGKDKEDRMNFSEVGKTYSKNSFFKAINEHADCDVKKWLVQDELGDRLLARLVAADQLLEPTKSAGFYGHTPKTLRDTRPTFRGTWAFKDPNAPRLAQPQIAARHAGRPGTREQQKNEPPKGPPPPSLVVVQVDWTDDEDGLYEKMKPRFFLLKPGHSGPKENMDIKLLELGESKAWQFSMESMMPVSEKLVSPALRGFADQVSMKPKYQIHSKDPFVTWTPSPSLKIMSGRIDKIYSFGIARTCYNVELTAMWYPRAKVPCWGVNVRHRDWSTHLCELETLPVGRCADWGDILGTFLPDDGLAGVVQAKDDTLGIQNLSLNKTDEEPPRDGIRLLAHKIMQLSEIITDWGGVPVIEPVEEAPEPKKTAKKR